MNVHLRKDLRTITEVLLYFLSFFAISKLYSFSPCMAAFFGLIGIAAGIYRRFLIRYREDIIMLPTQNDEASKMSLVAFGLVVLFFSSVGHFAFDMEIYQVAIGLTIGGGLIWFGLHESPKSWLHIKENIIEIQGMADRVDIRQLKEISIYSDRIVLINIYDEQKHGMLLKLTPAKAKDIQKFLHHKIDRRELAITNHVSQNV